MSGLPLPSLKLSHVWVFATLAATLPINTCTPTAIVDLGWTLRSGEWMVANRRVLGEDPFTTAPKLLPLVDQQWLAQIVMYLAQAEGGLELVIASTAVAATLAYAGALWAAWVRTGRLRIACGAVLVAYVLGFTNLGARAQTLAYPLFALFLVSVERRQRGGGGFLWWCLPVVMAVWANVHGSFTLGLLLLACAAAGAAIEQRRLRAGLPFTTMLTLCGLATLVTPWGLTTYAYLGSIGNHPILKEYVAEWSATEATTLSGGLFYLSAIALGALALRWPRALRPADWLVLGSFGLLALTASRGVVWWGLAVAPTLANLLAQARPAPREQAPSTGGVAALNWLIAAVIGGMVAMSLPWSKPLNPFVPVPLQRLVRQEMPERVSAFLAQRAYPGLMFNESVWGGYFEWTIWPSHRPFVDGRIEIYPLEVWQDYLAVSYPTPDWQEVLDRRGIGYLVLSANSNPDLVAVLETSRLWKQDYRDDQAVVFVRVGATP